MKSAKLLEKLRNLTNETEKVDEEHIKKLRKVLHKLKKRQQKLADELTGGRRRPGSPEN